MNKISYILWFIIIGLTATNAVVKRDRNDYTKNPFRLICYFDSWSHYHKIDPFNVEDVDVSLCTHINYAFATLNQNTLQIEMLDPFLDGSKNPTDLKGYERFVNLRKKNPNLTTMISLGGWKEGPEKFSDMARDPIRRKNFVSSIVQFLKEHDFDGLDLDWEFPGFGKGDHSMDKDDLTLLLKELRTAFDPLGYVLTAAVGVNKDIVDSAYHITDMNIYLDWVNLITYAFHGGWEERLGHNAPLYMRPEEKELNEHYVWDNVNFTVNYWVLMGGDKKKMVMGIPFFGTGYTLLNSTMNKLHDKANGVGPLGFIDNEKGVYGYNEICQMTNNTDWTHIRDPYYKAPYTYNKEVWIGYDDVDSVACKMGLSGGYIWGLEDDDFHNRCGDGKQPLLHKVHDLLNGVAKNTMECK